MKNHAFWGGGGGGGYLYCLKQNFSGEYSSAPVMQIYLIKLLHHFTNLWMHIRISINALEFMIKDLYLQVILHKSLNIV